MGDFNIFIMADFHMLGHVMWVATTKYESGQTAKHNKDILVPETVALLTFCS